jgi:hypothetical protein
MIVAGFLGALLALWGFVGIEFGEFRANTFKYDILNFLASLGLISYAISIQAWPYMLTSGMWLLVSLFDLLKISRRRRARRRN